MKYHPYVDSPILSDSSIKYTLKYNEDLTDTEKNETKRYWAREGMNFKDKVGTLKKRKSTLIVERGNCTNVGCKNLVRFEVSSRHKLLEALKNIDNLCPKCESENKTIIKEQIEYTKEDIKLTITKYRNKLQEYRNKLHWFEFLRDNEYMVVRAKNAENNNRIKYLTKEEEEILLQLISIPKSEINLSVQKDSTGKKRKAMDKFLLLELIVEIENRLPNRNVEKGYYYSDNLLFASTFYSEWNEIMDGFDLGEE